MSVEIGRSEGSSMKFDLERGEKSWRVHLETDPWKGRLVAFAVFAPVFAGAIAERLGVFS